MSLQALIDLANKSKDYRDGKLPPEEMEAIRQRQEASYERMKIWDKEIEERIRLKQPTAELLRKTCSI